MKGISFATEYKQANNIHRARQKEPRLQITKKCMPFARVNAICRFPANPHKRIDMPLSYLVSGQRTAFRFAVALSHELGNGCFLPPASEIIDAYIPQSLESLRHHLFARESCDAPSDKCARENPRFLRRAQ